jgi:hypothetical protein
MNRSLPMERRRFVKLMAAGLAALVVPATRARALAKAAAPRSARKPPQADPEHPTPAAVAREVAKQKKSLAETAKTLRAFDLPPGSPPASIFRALKRKER